jgi:membrane-associated phospholipid phosphatase
MRRRAAWLLSMTMLVACGSDVSTTAATTAQLPTIVPSATTSVPATTIAGGTTTIAQTTTLAVTTTSTSVPAPAPVARRWLMFTQDLVRADKPTPPESARLYAYVSEAYALARASNDETVANEAARLVLRAVSPNNADKIDLFARTIAPPATLSSAVRSIVDQLTERSTRDGWAEDAAADRTPPEGDGFWRSAGAGPFSPTAGRWQRWLVPADTAYEVPPPPAFGSAEYQQQLDTVQVAVQARDVRWVARINFWGGAPGTEAPAGIWQNFLWTQVGPTLATDDVAYSRVQSVLARTLADAFMECWKVKYQYWTARPDMVDPTVKTSMKNPPFPGYVSGHSTISAAAATVLGHLFPDRADVFVRGAQEARDSRLYAGIHFDVDNEQGFMLGEKIGDTIIGVLDAKA